MMDRETGLEESRIDRVYLGRVADVHATHEGKRLATLKPLLRSNSSGTEWDGPIQHAVEEFPERGVVFWWDVPSTVAEGSIWQFNTELHPTYDPPERPEKYQVVSPISPIEVVDMRRDWPEVKVRRELTIEGAYIHDEPIVTRVMIWFQKETWIGPVTLERIAAHRWKIDESEDLSRLQSHEASTALLRSMKVDGRKRIFLPPTLDAGRRIGFRNWMPDEQLASGILSRIRGLDQQAFDALGVTYRTFDTYQQVLRNCSLEGFDREQEQARYARIVELREIIAGNEKLVREAADLVLHTPSVQAELEARKQQIYAEVTKQERERVDAELQDRQKEVARLSIEIEMAVSILAEIRAEIQVKSTEIEVKSAEIDSLSGELDRAIEQFKTELTRRLRKLSESPEQAFTEAALLRTLIGPVGLIAAPLAAGSTLLPLPAGVADASTSGAETLPAASRGADAPGTQEFVEGPILDDPREIMKRMRDAFRNERLSPALGVHLHCAFLAGAVPIVTGTRAFDAIAAYASAVAGGRCLWVPVPGSTFEPQDLLARYDPATGTLVPHAAGLLEMLLEAGGSGRRYVVVLDGFNRAPVDSYLLPLLQCYSDAWLGPGRRSIPVAPAGLVRGPIKFSKVTRVAWPSNVLLAVIPSIGTDTFPVSSAVWDHVVLVDGDGASYPVPNPDANRASEVLQSAAPALWSTWRDTVLAADTGSVQEVVKLLGRENSHGSRTAQMAARVFAAARVSRLTETHAVELAVRIALLPRAVDRPADLIGSLTQLGIDAKEAESIHALATTLTG